MGIQTFQRYNRQAIYPGLRWSEVGPEAKVEDAPGKVDFPEATVAYIRWFWSQLEPERGKYRWDIIDIALDEARRLLSASQGSTHPVSIPILVYKVYPDGREELVRGMLFHGLNARSLKDILAAGDDGAPYEFMESTAPFSLVGYAAFTTEACVVAPSVLIDDLELRAMDEEQPKLPLAPAPGISR